MIYELEIGNEVYEVDLGQIAKGDKGDSIVWKGASASAPANPQVNWAYRNTTDGKSYIYDGTSWNIMTQDGQNGATGATGAQGPAGPNTVSTSTDSNINGILKGNGAKVAKAIAGTDYQLPIIAGENITIGEDGRTISATGGQGGTTDFEQLSNRPKYAGATMDKNTNIPSVPTKTSDLTNDSGFLTSHQSLAAYRTASAQDLIDLGITNRLDAVEGVIPSAASESNQLADKSFVNSSIATDTAFFKGTLDANTDLGLTKPASHTDIVTALNARTFTPAVTNNDYAFVINSDSDGNTLYERYKYTSEGSTWAYEYTLNNSSFTAAQWAAIASGITSAKVGQYDAHIASESNPHNVTKSQVGLGNVPNTDFSSQITALETAVPTKASKVANPTAGHVATLDSNGDIADGGKSVADLTDIIYGYLHEGTFYEDSAHTTAITPSTTKQYVDMTTATQPVPYMYNGSAYVAIGGGGSTDEIEEISANAFVNLDERVKMLNGGHLRTEKGYKKILTFEDFKCINNLTTTSATVPLSATQGKYLKDLSDANEVILAWALTELNSLMLFAKNIAAEYSPSTTYNVGDYCLYSGLLYKRTEAGSASVHFEPAKWTQTTVMAEILTTNA